MNQQILPSIAYRFVFSMALLVSTSAATVANATGTTVELYNTRIDVINREVRTAIVHRTALQKQLQVISERLTDVTAEETSIVERKPSLSQSLTSLQQDISALEYLLEQETAVLQAHQSLLNQQPQPSLLSDALGHAESQNRHRAIALHRYLVHRSESSVKKVAQRKDVLLGKMSTLENTSQDLSGYLNNLAKGRNDLLEAREALETKFSDLSGQIVLNQDRLSLFQDRLKEIEGDPRALTFTHYQGKLPDPTSGSLLHHFAEPKARGLLQWEGILVSAPSGQNIEAVFDGEVVFANRIQGLGNVAIIDHGEGYMSLYGTTDFLVVESGQKVLRGDVLGVVGESVGNQGSTLYFEVRHNATTVNPEKWLVMEKISLKD